MRVSAFLLPEHQRDRSVEARLLQLTPAQDAVAAAVQGAQRDGLVVVDPAVDRRVLDRDEHGPQRVEVGGLGEPERSFSRRA